MNILFGPVDDLSLGWFLTREYRIRGRPPTFQINLSGNRDLCRVGITTIDVGCRIA